MIRALVGYTGFVGSNLASQLQFHAFYNSKNIYEVGTEEFDELVIAAGDARKWYANQNPDEDWQHILSLFDAVKKIKARRVTLFSTIDVYNHNHTPVDEDSLNLTQEPYGRNRLMFELLVRSHYPNTVVLRLPGLFGKGLKKNLIFDLQNKRLDQICNYHPESAFQFLNMDRIGGIFRQADSLPAGTVVNVVSEPITVKQIVAATYPELLTVVSAAAKNIRYNVRSIFPAFTQHNLLTEIAQFVHND